MTTYYTITLLLLAGILVLNIASFVLFLVMAKSLSSIIRLETHAVDVRLTIANLLKQVDHSTTNTSTHVIELHDMIANKYNLDLFHPKFTPDFEKDSDV